MLVLCKKQCLTYFSPTFRLKSFQMFQVMLNQKPNQNKTKQKNKNPYKRKHTKIQCPLFSPASECKRYREASLGVTRALQVSTCHAGDSGRWPGCPCILLLGNHLLFCFVFKSFLVHPAQEILCQNVG
jgi:hypothetical protein